MKKKPSLLVIAYQKGTLDATMDHLREIGFVKHCKVSGVLSSEVNTIDSADLILVTSESVYKKAKRFIDKDIPYIIAKRSINFANIKDLLLRPRGSNVYLVSNMKEEAEETIRTLLEVGIYHNFIPYYGQPIKIDPLITIAVTPGELAIVPKTINDTINIGHRLLDMTTLFEIYEFFGISTYASDSQLTARYIQSIVSLIDHLNQEIIQSRGMYKSLEGIVDIIEEGLIVYDQSNKIISINTQALLLLDRRGVDLVSENISNIPSHFYGSFMEVEMNQENFADIDDISYYIRKKRIVLEKEIFSTVIIFEKTERIKNIETKYQRSTREEDFMAKYDFSDIKTKSPNMLSVIKRAKKMVHSNSTIFIHGETGTGKEIMAQAIHTASERKEEPFVAVSLAAISESLVESELFGYEKGAFTGASETGYKGMFERAHKGTIFLDEIGDASPLIQKRLLRVLQEREIQRVGGGHPIPINIRVITATNKDLHELIREKRFRDDLYYRLNILPIRLPPLRERQEDILLLSNLFIKEFKEKLQREEIVLSNSAIDNILNYEWPGNVRELKSAIEYLAHISEGEVQPSDLPFYSSDEGKNIIEYNDEKKVQQVLEEKGFLKESLQILYIFRQIGCKGVGRGNLLKLILEENKGMTEQKLRYRLEILSEMKLINVGQGRRGSSINRKGEEFLQFSDQ